MTKLARRTKAVILDEIQAMGLPTKAKQTWPTARLEKELLDLQLGRQRAIEYKKQDARRKLLAQALELEDLYPTITPIKAHHTLQQGVLWEISNQFDRFLRATYYLHAIQEYSRKLRIFHQKYKNQEPLADGSLITQKDFEQTMEEFLRICTQEGAANRTVVGKRLSCVLEPMQGVLQEHGFETTFVGRDK